MLSEAPPASEVHYDAPRRSRATPSLGHVLFGLDVRSMALYRIMLGLVMIGDLLDRAHDLRAHYTDEGVH